MGSPGAMRVASGYGFDRLADRHGFVVAYPQGHDGNWNDCRRGADYEARRLNVDDVGFFEALVGRLQRDLGIDPARVFVVGLSSGGHFVFRLAFERPERVAAAAVFAANLPTQDNNDCAARGRPPPIMLVNGTADPINPFEGGAVTLFGFGNRGTVISARRSAEYFARRRGLTESSTTSLASSSSSDLVDRIQWARPEQDSEVLLLAVHGGGHVLPQPAYRPPRLLGPVTEIVDGPDWVWRFFTEHDPRGPRP
jgi:polyhydroxybutyrate depolymerase